MGSEGAVFGAGLRWYEARLIEAAADRLSPESSERLVKQLHVINRVQRFSNGKEVNLYHSRWRRVTFDDQLRFPNVTGEVLLARVVVKKQEPADEVLEAEIWLASGRLFSILFSIPPKAFFQGQTLRGVHPSDIQVTIFFDPGRMDKDLPPEVRVISSPTGWADVWLRDGRLRLGKKPLHNSELRTALRVVDTAIPAEYLELLAISNGAKCLCCEMMRVEDVRRLVTDTGNYYVIGEVADRGALVLEANSMTGDFFFIGFDNSVPVPLGNSMPSALEEMCRLSELPSG